MFSSFFHFLFHFFNFPIFAFIASFLSFVIESFFLRYFAEFEKLPRASPGGLATPLLCLIVSSHVFIDFYLGPSVQPIPPDFV